MTTAAPRARTHASGRTHARSGEKRDGTSAGIPAQSDGAPKRASTPDEQLALAILFAGRAMKAIAERTLSETTADLTLPQHKTLVVLAEQGPRHLADLAGALGVSPSTATRMCDRLVRKRLITRTRDEVDRREVDLALTAQGKQIVDEIAHKRQTEIRKLVGGVPKEQREPIAEALLVVADAAGEVPDTEWTLGWLGE